MSLSHSAPKRDRSLTSHSTNYITPESETLPWFSKYCRAQHKPKEVLVDKVMAEDLILNEDYKQKGKIIKRKKHENDRFIPNRKSSKLSIAFTDAHEGMFGKDKENIRDRGEENPNSSLSVSQVFENLYL
jgi:hypothetical protein